MPRKPPTIYRMARCKMCPRHGKPCLTVVEANAILDDEDRRRYNGDDLCNMCCKKHNYNQNKKTFAHVGRDFDDWMLTPEERLQKEIDDLVAQLSEYKE